MADGPGLFPGCQPFYQLRNRRPEGRLLIHAAYLGLDTEIAQRSGGLHQGPAQKGAARLIGGKHHVPGHILGVKLPHACDNHSGHAAGKQAHIPPQPGEHVIVRFIAASLVQGHGKQEAPALQALQVSFRVGEDAAQGQQVREHFLQGRAICIFR